VFLWSTSRNIHATTANLPLADRGRHQGPLIVNSSDYKHDIFPTRFFSVHQQKADILVKNSREKRTRGQMFCRLGEGAA
jgi:hypothetical protein